MPVTSIASVATRAAAAAPPPRIHYAITREQVNALPEERRQAFALLVGLAQQQDVAGIAELKRLAGVGNPAGLPPGHEAIGPETLAKVAALFRQAGHPLTREHVNAFKANRHLTGGSTLGPTTAKALLDEVRGAAEPPADYTRVSFRGVTVNRRTQVMLQRAEARSRALGGPSSFALTQGSYHPGVSKSAGTHDGGGVVDVSVEGRSASSISTMVRALREAGFAAWSRGPADGMSPHIHAVAIGDRQLAPVARNQVWEYFQGGDGLVGSRPDGNRAVGRPAPAWARRYA